MCIIYYSLNNEVILTMKRNENVKKIIRKKKYIYSTVFIVLINNLVTSVYKMNHLSVPTLVLSIW